MWLTVRAGDPSTVCAAQDDTCPRLRDGSALALVRETRLHEALEERVRLVRTALEFRMILTREEVRMIPQLDQLRERAVR